AFLMNARGHWRLSPAFDITYAWNPRGRYTGRQQMSLGGKREDFFTEDLLRLATYADIKKARAMDMIARVNDCVRQWPGFAGTAGVGSERIERIAKAHRLDLL